MASAEELIEHAEALLAERRLAAAAGMFQHAHAAGAHPNRCDAGRWMIAMLEGDLERAWLRSDAIRARGVADEHRFWNGEALDGRRVIVRCLHGFGDAVQMFRYAPLLKARAASVVWEVPPRLVELAPLFPGVDEVVTWGEGAPAETPQWDVQIEVVELPYVFRSQACELPLAAKYLALPDKSVREAALKMGERTGPRAGLVWAAGEWNRMRSVPPACLRPLWSESGFEWWNLQGGEARTALDSMRDATVFCGDGIVALAATIANLDVVVTVDTLAAHLAGAMGKPVLLMLQHEADWRWQVGREDTPWYPHTRLVRQPAPGDWPSVVSAVVEALQAGKAR